MNPNTLLLPTVWPRAEATTLNRCMLLALLAHVWLVLTLGDAPGGTAKPGEGVWGAVNVTLRGPETAGRAQALPPEPAVATGAVGRAETPRWGGAVRAQTAPEVPAEAGAAQLGRWAPLPAAALTDPALAPLARAPVPALRPVLPTGLLPEPGRVLEERAVEAVPATVPVPMPVSVPVPVPVPVPVNERQLASGLNRATVPAPASAVESQALLPAAAAPVLAAVPELAAPRAAPLMAPRLAPPPMAQPVAALPSVPNLALPVVPAEPALPAIQSLAKPVQPVAAPVLPSAAGQASPTSPATATATAASPVTAGLPSATAPPGAVDAGTRLGHDVAGAPALPASAPPRLNLQLARPRGGELSRGLGGGVLAVMPRPPELDDKLGQQIAKTAKADCRSAYAGAGLLAVVPLALEAVRKDGGCKW